LTDGSFGSLRLWISEVFDFACLLAGLGRLRLLRLIFTLALVSFFHLLWPFLLTCFVFRLASCCDLHRLDLSTSLRALAVISLGGLIIFRMLGAYVDSSGTLISARWVHPSPLDFSVVKCTLVFHSGISGRVIVYEDFGSCRVIPLFQSRCSADDLSPLIGL